MTDTKTVDRETSSTKPAEKPAPKRILDLSATQLTGGALAAMTSAVIGARLGVAGTILGAAVGSVVAGVAGSLYTTSLRRTKDKITEVIVGRSDDPTAELVAVSDDTVVLTDWDATARLSASAATGYQSGASAATGYQASVPTVASQPVDGRGKIRSLPWKGILVSAAAVFVIALAGITAFEVISGHAISGGKGTTITQVSEGRSGGSSKPSQASSTQPSASATSSAEPSSEPSSESSQSLAPSTEPTTSAEPTTQSSEQATTNPSTDNRVGAATTSTDNQGSGAGSSAAGASAPEGSGR